MQCPRCLSDNAEGSLFCERCGAPLGEGAPAAPAAFGPGSPVGYAARPAQGPGQSPPYAPPMPPAWIPPAPSPWQGTPPPPVPRKRRPWVAPVVLIAVAALVAAAVVTGILLISANLEEPTTVMELRAPSQTLSGDEISTIQEELDSRLTYLLKSESEYDYRWRSVAYDEETRKFTVKCHTADIDGTPEQLAQALVRRPKLAVCDQDGKVFLKNGDIYYATANDTAPGMRFAGAYYLEITLTDSGREAYNNACVKEPGAKLTIECDGKAVGAITLGSQIVDYSIYMSDAGYTYDGVQELANDLSDSAMPVALEIVSVEETNPAGGSSGLPARVAW